MRIAKRSEKFSEAVSLNTETYGDFTDALEKARKAAREGFGAGSIVYLRKVLKELLPKQQRLQILPLKQGNQTAILNHLFRFSHR